MTQSIVSMCKVLIIIFKSPGTPCRSHGTSDIFNLFNPPIPLPEHPPDTPIYTTGMSENERDNAKLEWHAWRMEHANIHTMNNLLTDMFLNCIDTYKGLIMSTMVGQPKNTFVVIFKYFVKKYGQATPIDIENNCAKLKTPWDVSIPTDVFIKKIQDAAKFSK